MPARAVIPFLTDNNVPDSVGRWLTVRGHDVVLVREVMPANSDDPVVAEAAIRDGRFLVSWDRDFNHQRFQKPRFASLARVGFACPEPDAVTRLEAVIDWLELACARSSPDSPMLVRIASDKIMIRC